MELEHIRLAAALLHTGSCTARIAFDEPAVTVGDVRTATVNLARRARLRSSG
jgi:hypothetical protein